MLPDGKTRRNGPLGPQCLGLQSPRGQFKPQTAVSMLHRWAEQRSILMEEMNLRSVSYWTLGIMSLMIPCRKTLTYTPPQGSLF
jgi:hypothetical protein